MSTSCTAGPMLCAHCGRPMLVSVGIAGRLYHPECTRGPGYVEPVYTVPQASRALPPEPAPSDPAAGRWISVDERLPEPDSGEVLVWLTSGRCAFDEWHTYCEDPTGMGGPTMEMGTMWRDYEFDEITHWQPLPEPPPAAPGQAEGRGTDGQGG